MINGFIILGNYTSTPVILIGNQLSRFEDVVFENMLLQMKTTNDPSITFVDVDKSQYLSVLTYFW